MKKRLLCLFLTLALLVTVLLPAVPAAQASTKTEKTRAIGIVFDNSGSMYVNMGNGQDNRKAWCRATYAAEAFASMMNEGDQLILYPMNPITLGKNSTKTYTMYSPLVINGPGESETIRQIYSPGVETGTPFISVTAAYEDMKNVKADEKYLIVLTDGAFEDGQKPMDEVNAALDQYSNDIPIMFLGLGIASSYFPTESDPSRQHYVAANNTAAVLTELTAMCNQIFGRDQLPVSGGTATFDVSMSKLIVFIQGENISDVTLGGKKPASQHPIKYSELGTGNTRYDWQIDTSLQGVIATFEDLKAGSYDLKYNGTATSTTVYYEPDVDLKIDLVDGEGIPVGKELYPGTYKLSYSLWDGQLNQATESALLGNVNYTININGDNKSLADPSKPGSLELEVGEGDKLDGTFSVTYLKDYKITKTAEEAGWPKGGYTTVTRPVGQVTAKVEGGQDVYPLSQLEELAIYNVSIFCEGEQITGADLDRADLKVDIDGGNALPDITKTENGFTVSLKYNGSAADTTCGIQSATFSASYSNEDGNSGNADPIVREFEIQDDGSTLAVDIQLEQDYYVISKLDGAAPIRFYLTSEGAPLSPEQFASTDFQVNMDGLTYDLQPDPASSSYSATLQPGQKVEARKYKISCVANGFDEVGREISAEDSAKIECRPYPQWLPWLIAAAILVGLLSIILAIMNTKILPKKILLNDDVVFTVQGKEIPGAASCSFVGGNKGKGSLRIQSPPYIPNPLAQCGLSMALKAISPRRTKSRSRFAQVTRLTAQNPATTTSITVGGFQMEKDPKTNTLVPVGAEENAPISFRIGNNIDFEVVAKVPNSTGRTVTCTLSGTLRFM